MTNSENALVVQELDHIALHVLDLDASVRFYGGVLGLPSLLRPDFGFGGAWFALGQQELHLIEEAYGSERGEPPGHFALRVEDADAASLALRERGVTDLSGPAPRPDGAVQVFFRDPDGHLVEMVSFLPSDCQ